MQPVSGRFREAVRTSHAVAFRVDAYLDGVLVASDLPLVGGSVTVDRQSNVRRQAQVQIATEQVDPDVLALLHPYGTELRVHRGVRYLDGSVELVLLGTFVVVSTSRAHSGPTTLTCADRTSRMIENRFATPRSKPFAVAPLDFVQALLVEVYPDAQVLDLVPPPDPTAPVVIGGTTSPTAPAPQVVYDRERWDAIVSLARGAEVYFTPAGDLAIAPVPVVTDPADWVVDQGERGVLVTYSRDLTRDETYNRVVVDCERADGTVVRGSAIDDDPDSPTRWGGPFGFVTYFARTSLTTSSAGAAQLAQTLLAPRRQLQRTVELSCVPNPALDAGDRIIVVLPDGTTERHVVDRLSIPLDAGTAMGIGTRTSAPDPYLPSDPPSDPLTPPPGKPPEPNPPVSPPPPPPEPMPEPGGTAPDPAPAEPAPGDAWAWAAMGSSVSLTSLPESPFIEVSLYRSADVFGTQPLGQIDATLVSHRDNSSGTNVSTLTSLSGNGSDVTVRGDEDQRGYPFVIRVQRVNGLQYLRRLTIWNTFKSARLLSIDFTGADDAVHPDEHTEQLTCTYALTDHQPPWRLLYVPSDGDPNSHDLAPDLPGQPSRAYLLRQGATVPEELPPHCARAVQNSAGDWLADLRPAIAWSGATSGDQIVFAFSSFKGVPT